ncbi:hypothetical protein Plo01_53310 [Planobispora longispora]|uniref:Uncharacterized protein n=2 Tax=Planobispora longispora TaxID=28887 RepID=A0A8J3W7K4_9ACTN|nr:hypothetical protein Plo01_53310 [Planobispora longispora]
MVFAGLAGIILPFIVLAGVFAAVALLPEPEQCGHFGCLQVIGHAWVGGLAAIVLAWPLLHLLRVRPAWTVALAAPVFLMPVWRLAETGVGDPITLIVLSGAIAYPFAALVTTPRLPLPWRVLPVIPFAALYLIAWV